MSRFLTILAVLTGLMAPVVTVSAEPVGVNTQIIYIPHYGPFADMASCTASAGNRDFHGYTITTPCRWIGSAYISTGAGYYYNAY
jgi:hypothetical protein